MTLSEAVLFLGIAGFGAAFPSQSTTKILGQSHGHSIHLSAAPSPECFTLTLAPRLKQNQCNDELEWFLEEERKYDYLDFVGANAPYTFTRPRTAEDERGLCFVTVDSEDLFVTDQFTFEDLARFTSEVLRSCKDGVIRAGRGGRIAMTDARQEWGGFILRVDARNPYEFRLNTGNGTA